MSKNPEVLKIMQMRKFILQNLNRLYPTPIQVDTLYRVMCGFDEHYDYSMLAKDLSYLQQKGYVEFIDEKIGGMNTFRKKVVGLTAEGKEMAEGTQCDPALEI